MKGRFLFYVIAVVSFNAASEQANTFDFKSLPLSSNESELMVKFPDFRCRDPKDDRQRRLADRICTASPAIACQPNTWCENDPEKPWNYGGIRAKFINALFYSGNLHSISVQINPDQFQLLVDALRVKYGQESNSEIEQLQTRMGATYQNQRLTWERKDATIVASKYTSSINEGSILYSLKSSLQEYAKRSIKNRNNAAENL